MSAIEHSLIPRYERVTLKDGRRLILQNPIEITFLGQLHTIGIQVNDEGDGGTVERRHLITSSLIKRRTVLVMNNHYGMLEAVKGRGPK